MSNNRSRVRTPLARARTGRRMTAEHRGKLSTESGEDYKLLSINGMPVTDDQSYNMKLGGTISTGEYVSTLISLCA